MSVSRSFTSLTVTIFILTAFFVSSATAQAPAPEPQPEATGAAPEVSDAVPEASKATSDAVPEPQPEATGAASETGSESTQATDQPVAAPPPEPPPIFIPGETVDELATRITEICAGVKAPEDIAKLNSYAMSAIHDRLRLGMYRESLNLVFGYLTCFDRVKTAGSGVENIDSDLRDLACAVPSIVFSVEGKFDPDLSKRALSACRAPADEPMAGDRSGWASAVRRYLFLASASMTPAELYKAGARYLPAMDRLASDIGSAPVPGQVCDWLQTDRKHVIEITEKARKKPADVVAEGIVSDQEPVLHAPVGHEVVDSVFHSRLMLVLAAFVSGNVDGVLAAAGPGACGSWSVNVSKFLESVDQEAESCMKLAAATLAEKSSVKTMADTVNRVVGRVDSGCGLLSFLGSVVIGMMTADGLPADDGSRGILASLYVNMPVGYKVVGDPENRAALLADIVDRMNSRPAERASRIVETGMAMLEAGRIATAEDLFSRAIRDLPVDSRQGLYLGRFLVALNKSDGRPGAGALAARNLMAASPKPADLVAMLETIPETRVAALEMLFRGSAACGDEAFAIMAEVSADVLDRWPGKPESDKVTAEMEKLGIDESDADAFASWLILTGRNELAADRRKAGYRTLDRAVRILVDTPGVARDTALPRLIFWLVESGRPDMAQNIARKAARAGVVSPARLAAASRLASEKGYRRQSKSLAATAMSVRQKTQTDWLAIASVAFRNGDMKTVARALPGLGPDSDWGYNEWMLRGRYNAAKSRHAEADADFSRAALLRPDSCEPLMNRGKSLLLSGDASGAEADFWTCLNMGETHPDLLGGLAFAIFDQGRFIESTRIFSRALNLQPDNPENLIGLAMASFRAGDLDAARAAYNYAVEYAPVLARGRVQAQRAGYSWSATQKEAFDELRSALGVGRKRRR